MIINGYNVYTKTVIALKNCICYQYAAHSKIQSLFLYIFSNFHSFLFLVAFQFVDFFFVFVYREEVTSFLHLLLVIAPWLVMVFHACNTIRKHDFSKGSTWLKYSHWPRGMVVLTKSLGHERHKSLLIETFN
jgi:hypothetical protein